VNKKISIVFEETSPESGGMGFHVYLDGVSQHRRQEIDRMDPEKQLEELSTTEFWALRCFQITVAAMLKAGAVKEVQPR
jgi:hypothetical protein